jgi:hypothetical protein
MNADDSLNAWAEFDAMTLPPEYDRCDLPRLSAEIDALGGKPDTWRKTGLSQAGCRARIALRLLLGRRRWAIYQLKGGTKGMMECAKRPS